MVGQYRFYAYWKEGGMTSAKKVKIWLCLGNRISLTITEDSHKAVVLKLSNGTVLKGRSTGKFEDQWHNGRDKVGWGEKLQKVLKVKIRYWVVISQHGASKHFGMLWIRAQKRRLRPSSIKTSEINSQMWHNSKDYGNVTENESPTSIPFPLKTSVKF